jgi:Phage integrase family
MPLGGRPWALRGQVAGRDLCRGAARSAALRGGPAGRRFRMPRRGRLRVTTGRGRPHPHPIRALRAHKKRQAGERLAAGAEWSDQDLVFCTRTGGALDAGNVCREFRAICEAAGIGEHWTPRELCHSFVSLMSNSGVPVEEIAWIARHSSTRTTEVVSRRELRPILTTGAEAMDRLFKSRASNLCGERSSKPVATRRLIPCHEFRPASAAPTRSRRKSSPAVSASSLTSSSPPGRGARWAWRPAGTACRGARRSGAHQG